MTQTTAADEPLNITGAIPAVEHPLLSRRDLLRTGGVALIGVSVGTAFKCGSEKVSLYVSTITSFLREISTLVPAQSAFIGKAITAANELDAAYRRGDFDSATTFLETLSSNINTLITSLGVGVSSQVKVALAIIGSSVRLIAVLINNQASDPAVASAAAKRTSPDDNRKRALIKSLADEKEIDTLLEASRP